jgi:hypothetical protein
MRLLDIQSSLRGELFRFNHSHQIIHRGVQFRRRIDSSGFIERLA